MKRLIFKPMALEQFQEWRTTDPKLFKKINDLIRNTREDPFSGLGKPEALKHQFQGCWSRRINKEHRLVYKVTEDAIIVIACKYHY